MSKLNIEVMVLGPIETNVYIISNDETKTCVIIDPATKSQEISQKIKQLGLKPVAILLTHGHFDHLLAVKGLREIYPGITVYAHEDEVPLIQTPKSGTLGADFTLFGFTPDALVHDGQVLELLGYKWMVLHTPGHTCGSVCYYIPEMKWLIAGDTVFEGTYGRTDLETGSQSAIIGSFRDVIFKLPDDIEVFPGHGPATQIGYEKKYNEILMDM